MAHDTLLALCVFAFVTSVSPGPSNLMLLASGTNFGFARTVPQLLGITLGFAALLVGVGLGLGTLLAAAPMLERGLKLAGALYLLHLAWRIAKSRSLGGSPPRDGAAPAPRPLTLLESAAFQWVNPKAWAVAATAMAVYAGGETPLMSVGWVALAFAAVNLPSVALWVGFGIGLRGLLSDPVRLKWFNIAMGTLLAAALWPMVAG